MSALSAQRRRVAERRAQRNVKPAPATVQDTVQEGHVYEVEDILQMRNVEDGSREYLVKWKDFDERCNSWEAEREFITGYVIKEFLGRAVVRATAESAQLQQEVEQEQRDSLSDTAEANTETAAAATAAAAAAADTAESIVPFAESTSDETLNGTDGPIAQQPDNTPVAQDEAAPHAQRKRNLDVSSQEAESPLPKRVIADQTSNDSNSSPCEISSMPGSASSPAASEDSTSGVLLTPELAAELVQADDFEDCILDCFVWQNAGTKPRLLGVVSGFARRVGEGYSFGGRNTDIVLLVKGKDGATRPTKFSELCDYPLRQEDVENYREGMSHTYTGDKWSPKWAATKSSQIEQFLSDNGVK